MSQRRHSLWARQPTRRVRCLPREPQRRISSIARTMLARSQASRSSCGRCCNSARWSRFRRWLATLLAFRQRRFVVRCRRSVLVEPPRANQPTCTTWSCAGAIREIVARGDAVEHANGRYSLTAKMPKAADSFSTLYARAVSLMLADGWDTVSTAQVGELLDTTQQRARSVMQQLEQDGVLSTASKRLQGTESTRATILCEVTSSRNLCCRCRRFGLNHSTPDQPRSAREGRAYDTRCHHGRKT